MSYYGMLQLYFAKNELAHSRTKGSRNGYSTVKGYTPVGKKAIGRRLPDGTYAYERVGINGPASTMNRAGASYVNDSPASNAKPNPLQSVGQYMYDNIDRKTHGGLSLAVKGAQYGANKVGEWGRGLPDQAKSAGSYISDRWNDLGKAANEWGGGLARSATGAARNATDAVSSATRNFASDPGKYIGKAAGMVGRYIVDDLDRKTAGAASRVGRAVGKAAGDWWNTNATSDYGNNDAISNMFSKQAIAESRLNDLAMKEQALDAVRGTNREAGALAAFRQAEKDYEKAMQEYEQARMELEAYS